MKDPRNVGALDINGVLNHKYHNIVVVPHSFVCPIGTKKISVDK